MSAVRAGRALAALAAVAALACAAAGRASAAPAAAPTRATMIVLDVNASFYGSAATAERAAALAYLRALPPDVRAGLITFGSAWKLVDAPITDRRALAAAISSAPWVSATSNALPSALTAAQSALQRLGPGTDARMLVLSDAEFFSAGLPSLAEPVDVVTWRLESDDRPLALRGLATASGGRVASPNDAAGLAAAFPALPAHPRAKPSAAVTGPAASALPAATPWHLTGPLLASVAALAVGIVVLVLASRQQLRSGKRRRKLAGRVARYGPARTPATDNQEDGKTASTVVALAEQALRARGVDRSLAEKLDLAGLTIKPPEFVVLGVCVSVVLAAVVTVLTGNPLLGVPLGGLVGWLVMRLVLSVRTSRRRAAFADQLPDVLQLIASSLQSGFSLAQALDAVVREGSQPAATEFSRALAEARFGADLADALEGVAARMDSRDMRWTVMAIRIQRSVGGNLAEVLRNTIGTMRERAFLQRHVKALSAEGRLSAYILVALPILLGAWLFYSSPSYMRLLYTTVYGVIMLGGSIVLMVIGAFWMRATIKVEV